MTRIVDAVTYRALAVRRSHKRTVETLYLALEVPAEIAEIALSDMKTAARVRNPDGTEASYVTYGARFFEPVVDVNDGRPIFGAEVDDYFAGRTHRASLAGFSSVVLSSDRRSPARLTLANQLPRGVGDDIKTIISDDTEQRMLEVQRQMAAFVLVDGTLWRDVGEPSWIIRRRYGRARLAPQMQAGIPDGDPGNLVFRLDRAMDADRYVRELSKKIRTRYDGSEPFVDLIEAPLRRNDRLQSALALGQCVVELLPQGWLRLMPREAILQWSELRVTVKAIVAGGAVDADIVAGRAGRLLDVLDGLILNRYGEEDRAAAKRCLFDVLSRWTNYEGGMLTVPSFDETDDEALSALTMAP